MGPWTAHLPPGTGGGEGVAPGRQGQGSLIHRLTDAAGRPWSPRTTPATGDARAQVIPRLATLRSRTGNRGRPRQRLNVIAADQGDAAKQLRQRLRRRGVRPQIPNRVWQTQKPRGRPLSKAVPRCQAARTVAWCQRQYRRVVLRWERLAACLTAFLARAMIQMWSHRLIVG